MSTKTEAEVQLEAAYASGHPVAIHHAEAIVAEERAGQLRVGSTVWRNIERHYRPAGYKVEDDFLPLTITGETRVSWIAKEGWTEFKFPKAKPADEWNKDPETRLAKGKRSHIARIYLTRRAVDDAAWFMKNAISLHRHFESLVRESNPQRVRELAKLTGYVETP